MRLPWAEGHGRAIDDTGSDRSWLIMDESDKNAHPAAENSTTLLSILAHLNISNFKYRPLSLKCNAIFIELPLIHI